MSALNLALAWRKKREERIELQKQVDALEAEEKALQQQVIEALQRARNKSVSNGDRLFQIVTTNEPQVDDWNVLYKHILSTGHFELLHRRINSKAIKERWDEEEKIPGIGSIPVTKLSDTKAKS